MRLLYVFILCLAAMTASAQSEEPFKGANQIIFECRDSAENLYLRLGKHLISKGYAITGEKDFLNIKTQVRGISRYSSHLYTINSIVQGNRIVFTIDLSGISEGTLQTVAWEYAMMPKIIGMSAYKQFLEYMAGFERTRVYYNKY